MILELRTRDDINQLTRVLYHLDHKSLIMAKRMMKKDENEVISIAQSLQRLWKTITDHTKPLPYILKEPFKIDLDEHDHELIKLAREVFTEVQDAKMKLQIKNRRYVQQNLRQKGPKKT